jgi:hypothetical protein
MGNIFGTVGLIFIALGLSKLIIVGYRLLKEKRKNDRRK